jgi:hypothetical protein
MPPNSALLVLLLSYTVLTARADDISKRAKVEEFFRVAKLDQLMARTLKQTMDQVNSGMMQQMLDVKLPADQQQRADELSKKAAKIVSEALSWDKIEPEYAKLYAATYTEEEIEGMLVFYKSPVGQAMVDKSPTLMKQSTEIVQVRMKSAMPELQKLMKDCMAEATATKAAEDKPKE